MKMIFRIIRKFVDYFEKKNNQLSTIQVGNGFVKKFFFLKMEIR